MSQAGPSQQLWYALSHINTLQRGLSERHHTVDITCIRPVLKERVYRREDEVPSRVWLIGRPLSRPQARTGVLLKGLLVGCVSDRERYKDGQETRPATHAALGSEGEGLVVAESATFLLLRL